MATTLIPYFSGLAFGQTIPNRQRKSQQVAFASRGFLGYSATTAYSKRWRTLKKNGKH